jgi:hypothetical protein
MPKFDIETTERCVVRARYTDVEAESAEAAVLLVRGGLTTRRAMVIQEGRPEILAVKSVVEPGDRYAGFADAYDEGKPPGWDDDWSDLDRSKPD